MKKRITEKIIATILTLVLTTVNLLSLAQGVFAAVEETNTNNKDVKMESYWKQEKENKSAIIANLEEKQLLYIKIGVNKSGYLKEGIIKLEGNNFRIEKEQTENAISEIDTENNIIKLNRIKNGEEIEIAIPVSFDKKNEIELNYFGRETTVKLEGTYIDENGKEVKITGETKVEIKWETEAEIEINQEVEKYLKMGTNSILQTKLIWGVKENKLPIQEANIEITVPEIKGMKPSRVKIVEVNSLQKVEEDNYKYNKETGKISINVKNEANTENKIKWETGKQEYKIIYEYEVVEEAITEIDIKSKINAKLYPQETEKMAQEERKEKLEEKGSIVSGKIDLTGEIGKGYLYANNKYESSYQVKENIEISDVEYAKEIEITHNSNFILQEEKKLAGENSNYIEETKIKKEQVNTILGENGKLNILDDKGNNIATIDKETKANEQGEIIITYENPVSRTIIQIHNPEKEGQIEIQSKKKIKGQTGYSIDEMKQMIKLEEVQKITVDGKTEETKGEIELQESSSKVEITSNNSNLSTVMKNENVELRVILNADNSKYDLWKNPVIEIELPKEVESIDIKGVSLLFSDEIQIEKCELVKNDAGNLVIRVVTKGEQTEYVPEINRGIQIAIIGDITLDKKSASTTEQIKARFTNEKHTKLENEGLATTDVNIYSPVGVIALNTIRNFNGVDSEITSMGSMAQVGKLEILTEKRIATNQIMAINNVGYTLSNPYILGRLGFVGNKKLTGEDLGSNIDTVMASKIRAVGIKEEDYTIYYSENGEATGDITKAENKWELNPEDISKVKSYLIIWNNKEMKQGEQASFEYDIEIPEALNYNKTAYSTYAIYYENRETRVETENKMAQAPEVGISTGEGPELEVSLTADVAEGKKIQEETRIKYTATVENKGGTSARNVSISANIPEGTTYLEHKNIAEEGDVWIEDSNKKVFEVRQEEIKAGEKFKVDFYIKANEIQLTEDEDGNPIPNPNIEKNISTKLKVQADNIEKIIETSEYKNIIIPGLYKVHLETDMSTSEPIAEGQDIALTTRVENVNAIPKNDIIITYVIPEGLDYKEAYIEEASVMENIGINYDDSTRTITWKINSYTNTDPELIETEEEPALEGYGVISVTAVLETSALNELKERKIKNLMKVTSREMTEPMSTNELDFIVAKPQIEIEYTSNKPNGRMKDTDSIEYYVNITNKGKVVASIELTDTIPEALSYQKIECNINGKVTGGKTGKDVAKLTRTIGANTTAYITIYAKAKPLEGEDFKEIENKVEITSINAEIPPIDSLKHIIEKSNSIVGPDGNQTKVYSIEGVSWLDKNRDGIKQTEEERISGIEAILVNAETGEIVKDLKTKKDQRVNTNEKGEYIFSNVANGSYFVAFLYDTSHYGLTSFQKENASSSENSDVIATQLNLDGEVLLGAITETLTVENHNLYNIDIGLIESPTFDLSLDKVITKVIVQNNKGTKQYEFQDSKLAKVDIDAKYLESTNILIEYKIKVKNEGKLPGYIKNLVDYLPKQFQFSSELNKNWYVGKDGELYNSILENTLIQPGETKEITLTLMKKMTEDGTGTISNIAEIAESYNEQGIQDIDSVPGNKKEGEDDLSSADIIIGIKTGKEITYTILILSVISLIGVGVYFINKKAIKG